MDSVEYLIVGAGVSGLSFANWLLEKAAPQAPTILILEADTTPGGYCKTVRQDGFVWDYAGHFFHFRDADIHAWLRARMPKSKIHTVRKRSFVRYGDKNIDFPFQKNIHQLPQQEFLDCLYELFFREEQQDSTGLRAILYQRFGKGIAERFLVPYNEKVYACDLTQLDREAMGRFFPQAEIADIIRNMRSANNDSYNATFDYPENGAIAYVDALLSGISRDALCCSERLVSVDIDQRIATTSRRKIRYERLISSAPLNDLARACGLADSAALNWSKVLVYNLGFDKKGARDIHWLYIPNPERAYYRVGWYDNIVLSDRMSLYVEIGAARTAELDADSLLPEVLAQLRADEIVSDQELVSWHSVVLDPAYVHITKDGQAEAKRLRDQLSQHGVYSFGRYGSWTYCSIEDNMIEARELVSTLLL